MFAPHYSEAVDRANKLVKQGKTWQEIANDSEILLDLYYKKREANKLAKEIVNRYNH